METTTSADARQEQRDYGVELMHRVSDSGHAQLITRYGHPRWLVTAVSQILAAAGTDRVLYVGHTFEDYDGRRELDGTEAAPNGHILAVTDRLLLKCVFSERSIRTKAFALRAIESLEVTRITDVRNDSSEWPNSVVFEVKAAGEIFTFPPSASVAAEQYDELRVVLSLVRETLATA